MAGTPTSDDTARASDRRSFGMAKIEPPRIHAVVHAERERHQQEPQHHERPGDDHATADGRDVITEPERDEDRHDPERDAQPVEQADSEADDLPGAAPEEIGQ
jgi:hypothetical protein